jgi:Flp pilus assembly protein TadD
MKTFEWNKIVNLISGPVCACLRRGRRVCAIATGLVLLCGAGACTTTTVAGRTAEVRPAVHNNDLSDLSELHIASTALDSGNIDLATTLFEKVVAADPKSVAGLTGLGNTLYTVGDFTRAGVYYDRASQTEPTAIAPMIGIARVAIHQRRFDDAISTYQKVLSASPNNALAAAGLGAALDLKGDHAGAQAELRSALRTSPGDPMLSINLGLSLILGGNPREGANVLLDVTRFPAAPPQALQDLALAYGMLGNTQAAEEILGHDLPKASVDDNLRFYEIQRSRAGSPLTSTQLSSMADARPVSSATDVPVSVK